MLRKEKEEVLHGLEKRFNPIFLVENHSN